MEYSASFTGAGLMFQEVESLYPILIQPNAFDLLEQEIKENKYLRINAEKSRKIVLLEIKKRIQYTDQMFWAFYKSSEEKGRRLLLFYNVLKTYRVVYDFHLNVTLPRFLSLEAQIDNYKYQMRLDEIASTQKNVAEWSESTREKLITRYKYMLESAGLSKSGHITRPDVPAHFYCFFIEKEEYWVLDSFFLKQHEKEAIIKNCNDN